MTHLNSDSMKTVVETYIIEETQDLIYDNEKLDQWNKRVEELGLEGQARIVSVGKSPIPFLHMKNTLVRTFETLCPVKVDISKYDKTPIPVELLDLVALSKRENYFFKIQVWYDDQSPDPAIVGFTKSGEFDPKYPDWDRGFDKYLLGRWADVKQPLEELVQKAKGIFFKKCTVRIEQEIKDAQRKLEDLGRESDKYFGDAQEGFFSLPF